ncbi:GPI-anchored protein PB15E9.01c isoform X2 [Biomphalaria glabrata]|nr:GPI-anchored protein PB15E9.01c isoform X2 [Biomphalaria glabrata]
MLAQGSTVQCYVAGQLAVNYFGNTKTVTQTSSDPLLNLVDCLMVGCTTTTTITYTPTVTSGCPQFLVITTNGLMTSSVCCLETNSTVKNYTALAVSVDWFAAD